MKKTGEFSKVIPGIGGQVYEVARETVNRTESTINNYVVPARETILKRYPTLFTLAVTLGAISMFLGVEQMLLKFSFINEHPATLFWGGVLILAITGRLYKKLS